MCLRNDHYLLVGGHTVSIVIYRTCLANASVVKAKKNAVYLHAIGFSIIREKKPVIKADEEHYLHLAAVVEVVVVVVVVFVVVADDDDFDACDAVESLRTEKMPSFPRTTPPLSPKVFRWNRSWLET